VPAPSQDITIRAATEADLGALYTLARDALHLDTFSPSLLSEKLFSRPRANEMQWRAYLAERAGQAVGFMQSVMRPAARRAWMGLFAVQSDARRQDVATALFQRVRQDWPPDAEPVEVLAIPANYFAPGLDPRYTAALAFLERAGFERFRDCVNLRAALDRRWDTRAAVEQLARGGVEVRRATPADAAALDRFFAANFGEDWRFEAGLALANDPPALHLALEGGAIIAFSAHSTQNREWGFFGPMGTTDAARGRGVGRVLLWECLNDLRDAGHTTCVIPWVGPIAFYADAVGAAVERIYWRYRRAPLPT
jgi:GNAT superfamily N-acetyltransferase